MFPNSNEIFYVYPMWKNDSFSLISRQHIKYLRNYCKIEEIDEDTLDNLYWQPGHKILLHPILYPLLGERLHMVIERQRRLNNLLRLKGKLGGFETADSDAISKEAVEVLNKMDLIFVPSNFVKDTYKNSGVASPVEVLPHGLSENFMREKRLPSNDFLRGLANMKANKGYTYMLFFYQHSAWRKGADIVADTYMSVRKEYNNLVLILKGSGDDSPVLRLLRMNRIIEIPQFLSEDDLVDLYDLADILVVPSRGGGFELNAIEGIARGCVTIVPDFGCFKDYIEYTIPVFAPLKVKVFRDNPIHIGLGRQVEKHEYVDALCEVARNIESHKRTSAEYAQKVREKYSWDKVVIQLLSKLQEYRFLE
jgi:glycosyltransferase involved in cell wall biosynthesis